MTLWHTPVIFAVCCATLVGCRQNFDLAFGQVQKPANDAGRSGDAPGGGSEQVDLGRHNEVEVSPGLFNVTARFNVAVEQRKADVLFVIDNSASMQEEQQNVRDSFARFLAAFEREEIDFHIGVISTNASTDAFDWGDAYNGFVQNGPGTLISAIGNSRFLTSAMAPSLVTTQFRQNVNLGLAGNGAETGLLSVQKFLNPSLRQNGGWNENFLRRDALFSTIIVSDEDEGLSPTDINYLKSNPALFAARLNALQTIFQSLKPGRPDLIRFDAIVAPSQAECPTVGQTNGLLGTGDAYVELSRRLQPSMSPRVTNICQDFSQSLVDIGQEIAVQVERRFELPSTPFKDLKVSINGQVINQSATAGWTYNTSRRAIELNGLELESRAPRFVVEVSYLRR